MSARMYDELGMIFGILAFVLLPGAIWLSSVPTGLLGGLAAAVSMWAWAESMVRERRSAARL